MILKNKKKVMLVIGLLISFSILTVYNFHINIKVAGDNFYQNYPYLADMADSYQITYVQAVIDAFKYGFIQTLLLFYLYLHIVTSISFIKNGGHKTKIFSIIINILIGFNCVFLIPVYVWGNSIHGGIDSIGEAILFGLIWTILIYGSFLLSIIQSTIYAVKYLKTRRKTNE